MGGLLGAGGGKGHVDPPPLKLLGGGCPPHPPLPTPMVLLISIVVKLGPTAFAISAGGACLNIFSLFYHFSIPI